MSQYFIGFGPITDVYKQAIHPYKKWTDYTDMSPLIERDGDDYRIIRVAGKLFKSSTKYILLCDKGGQIIEDVQLNRAGFNVYYLLAKLQSQKESLINSKDESVTLGLKKMYENFKKLGDGLSEELTDAENRAMREQLEYFESNIKLSINIEQKAKELLFFIEQLTENKLDKLTLSLTNQMNQHFFQWQLCNIRMELLTIKNGKTTRPIIKKIIYNADNLDKFPEQDFFEIIIEYMNGIDGIEESYLHSGKLDWEQFNKESFNLDTYLEEAWEGRYINFSDKTYQDEMFAVFRDSIKR